MERNRTENVVERNRTEKTRMNRFPYVDSGESGHSVDGHSVDVP